MIVSYPVTAVNRVKRLHERGSYDHATIHALLDDYSGKTSLSTLASRIPA